MKKVLVIGGSGFLGSALVRTLKQKSLETVHSFDLVRSPDVDVESVTGDLCDPAQVLQACAGVPYSR